MNKTLRLLIFLFCLSAKVFAQPSGFQDNVYATNFNGANGITFDASGRTYVWEKDGKVKCRTLNGVWHQLLDISEEVNSATDSGLKGFALHPNFLTNGFIYLLYDVDRHHLMNFGTTNYNPNASELLNASIGRITRYTVNISNFTSIVSNSRLVLLGTSPSDGIPFIFDTHNVGSLVFGTDGTLLASCGESSTVNSDSGYGEFSFFQQALNDGILKSDDPATTTINENENVGSWRAQMVNCLSGKILRIDPLTGDGIPSNPFYDASQPRAAKSRVWAMGFRNPFRMTVKPNTGEHLPSAGNPGVIYVGEVGSLQREEIDVVTAAGQNFGWPRFEGIVEQQPSSVVQYPYNRGNQFSVPFTHKRPVVDYRASPARAYVNGQIHEIGTSAPNAISGLDFLGGCSVAGVFYNGTNFPPEYQGRYFHGNFNNNGDPDKSWIHGFSMNTQDELTQMHSFLPNALGVTGMAINPVNGYLYYVSYGGSVREVKYDTGNQPPIAKATQDVKYGTSPLTVQFNANQSSDPESGTMTYLWDFGDGSSSTSINPTHVFTSPNSNPIGYNVTLTVTDNTNQTNSISLIVSVNNTPPVINSTTIDQMNLYANTSNIVVNLQANVTDIQTPTPQLSFKWETSLHHDTHFHPNPVDTQQSSSFTMTPLPCDNEVYYYQVKLTVTDAQGLSTVKTKNIVPNCGQIYVDTEIPSTPTNLQLTDVHTSSISFSWTPSVDNVGVALYEIFKDGVKIDESLNSTYTATGLQSSTLYRFKVTAKDAAGNISSQSDILAANTNAPVTQDLIIFGDALHSDWNSVSSSISSLYFFNTTQPFINTTSIKVTNPTINETLDLRLNSSYIDTTGYSSGLSFWVYNEGNTAFPLQIQTFNTNTGTIGSNNINVNANPNQWTHFQFSWNLLGYPAEVGKIVIRLNQTQAESLYFDEIRLLYCADMQSIKTGNWNDSSVWSCGRIPIVTDDITINAGHTVSIPSGVNATLKFLYLLGTLNPLSGSTFNIYKF